MYFKSHNQSALLTIIAALSPSKLTNFAICFFKQSTLCSKCANKDNLELSAFKNFVEENGLEINSLSQISCQTGISEKNLNRFLDYDGLEGYKKLFN